MQASQPIMGGKNLLGICAAIGQDLGFNPLWLRLALAMSLLFQPVAVLSAYAALGITVALSRWLYPSRRPVVPEASASSGLTQIGRGRLAAEHRDGVVEEHDPLPLAA